MNINGSILKAKNKTEPTERKKTVQTKAITPIALYQNILLCKTKI